MKTRLIENLQNCGNLDTDIMNDTNLMQKKQMGQIVLLDEENGSGEFIKDEVNITYNRKLREGEETEYEDEDGRIGYKQIYNFEREEFEGKVAQVCLAPDNFIDPRIQNDYDRSANYLQGSGMSYNFSATDYLSRYTRVLDVDFENGTLLTFDIKYQNGEWSGVFCKWNHNLRNIRIGGAASYFYLNELISVDIGDLITIPDTSHPGQWKPVTDMYKEAMLYYGIDETNNRYVLTYTTKQEKVFNTLILQKEDITQTVLHQMVLPNEASWASNQSWGFNSRFGYNSRPSIFYKGKQCMPLYTVRTEHEQEIPGVYMCEINPEDSTDIKALETHCYNSSHVEVSWNSNMPDKITQPLIGTGCGSAISSAWTIKNDIGYIKQGGTTEWGFYYKGLMLKTEIGGTDYVNWVRFKWNTCPYCLSIYETLSKPFMKTLNRTLKYTFRIVNTGGQFYD